MTGNIALYERVGFRETERVSEKGSEPLYMAKTPGWCNLPQHRQREPGTCAAEPRKGC